MCPCHVEGYLIENNTVNGVRQRLPPATKILLTDKSLRIYPRHVETASTTRRAAL